jgi:hypothetical protein
MKMATRSLWIAVLVIGSLSFVWVWGFCRFYVEPDHMAVIVAKTGRDLPPGQILADKGQKGIQEEVLGEGRHFRDPVLFDREILPVVHIPPGKVGLVTSKIGKELPPGEFLAAPGQKGIWRTVLGPGKYRLNPYGYRIDVIPAVSIRIGYGGVITSLSGEQAPEGAFAAANQKGVRSDILQPGLYYINPKEFLVNVVEIGVNQVSLLGKVGGAVITKGDIQSANANPMDELQDNTLNQQRQQRIEYMANDAAYFKPAQASTQSSAAGRTRQGWRSGSAPQAAAQQVEQQMARGEMEFTLSQFVEFPSRDGFEISLDLTVEFELLPNVLAAIYRAYGDMPAVVDKIIMPQILSVSRNKGSVYRAMDFIAGEGREKFQKDMTEALATTLKEKNIVIHNALIRHVNVPAQILDPVQKASIAVEQDLTNKEKQNTAKQMALLNTDLTMIEQRRQQVAQETEKMKAEIRANQDKGVAEIQVETLRKVAVIEKDTAGARADRVRKVGKVDAEAVRLVDGERARGFQLKTKAFDDAQAYSLWEFANQLNPDVKINILHAGPGTLWTDLEKARLGDLGGAKTIAAPAAKPR